jgi:hypothetical protein
MQQIEPTPKSYNFFFLWALVALIYVANGLYMQFYVKGADISESIFNYAMAVTWLSIGWSFSYIPPAKK